jgi:ATP-binding cassette subfamily B protein
VLCYYPANYFVRFPLDISNTVKGNQMIFKEYLTLITQKKGAFLIVIMAVTMVVLLDIYIPLFYKNIANGFTQPYSPAVAEMMLANLSYVVMSFMGIWLGWRVSELGMIFLVADGLRILAERCFAIFQQQRYVFFQNQFSGSLVKQAHRFAQAYETIVDWFLFSFLMNLIAIIASFVIFYQQETEFAYYFLIWIVIFIGWTLIYSLWVLKFDKEVAKWDSKLGGLYSDAIANIAVIKGFALEAIEQTTINKTAERVYRKRKKAWLLLFVSFAVQSLLAMGIEVLLVYLMIQKWKQGEFDVGEFVLFQSILIILVRRLWDFGRAFRSLFRALADAAEMAAIFDHKDIEQDSAEASDITIKRGAINFQSIDFSYAENKQQGLFEQFSLSIKAGESVAFVGHSGSGKTTLTQLLFRFFELNKGKILFDGIDSKQFTLTSLRQQISLIPQQPELFHRSIRENIALGKSVTDERLVEVAQQSRSLAFIQQLPKGFDTLVGERGVKLSGGEKHRIAIARAFLEDAPIIVLDEATSALDSLTEKEVQTAIFELIAHKTAIVIAHRLATILHMDRIVVLDNGTIIEEGTHEELLALKGKYATMWAHQSDGFIDDNGVFG